MPCCIERCPPGKFALVKFPSVRTIRTRWRDAIKAGTGTIPSALNDLQHVGSKTVVLGKKWNNDAFANDDELQPHICLGHFPDPDNPSYQDPTVFVNRIGKRVRLECCRLCHRFASVSQMYPLDGQLSGQYLNVAILQTMKIRLKQEEDPRFLSICRDCLVKVDLVKVIQNQYLMLEGRHVNFLRLQTPLEMVEPMVSTVVIDEEDEEAKEEIEEVCTNQVDDCMDVPVKTIVDEKKMEAVISSKEVAKETTTDVPAKTRVIIKRKEPKFRVKVPSSGEKMIVEMSSDVMRQPTKEVSSKKRVVVKRKFRDKVPQVSPLKKIRMLSVAAKTCYICPIELADAEHLLAHLTEEHAAKIEYTCQLCDGKQLRTIKSYNVHLGLHDSNIRPLQCNFCTLRYCTKKGLEVHEITAHGAPHKLQLPKKRNRQMQCEHCGKVFKSISSVREHKLVAHEQGAAAQCKICLKTFGYKNSLYRHMIIHSGELPYKCDTCGIRFKIVTDLTKHIQGDHQGKMPYYCYKCNIPLKDKNAYHRHRNQHRFRGQDSTKRLVKCALCSITCDSLQDLQAHIDDHHPNQDYPYTQCPFCPERYLTPSQMQMHKYTKHRDQRTCRSTKLLCTICGEQQDTRQQLESHMTRVHGAEKKYACTECDSRFTIKRNLIRHRDLHNKVKRFACEFCAKTFNQKVAMDNHRRNLHTGEKAFECKTCGIGFKESSTYYRHRATCEEKAVGE